MLPRILEPEAMDSADEAADYDAMDHAEVNRAFVADLLAASPWSGEALDLGTGTALIPIELCRQHPAARVTAADASVSMLAVARQNVERAGLADRIRLDQVDAKRLPYPDGAFGVVISNSLVHHLADPRPMFAEAWRLVAPRGLAFFRDLLRPDDEATLEKLVDAYTAGATPLQRKMLEDSLRAALTLDEVRRLVASLGQPSASVRATSDRHWTWAGQK